MQNPNPNKQQPGDQGNRGDQQKEFDIKSPKPDKFVQGGAPGEKQDGARRPNTEERHPSTISGENESGATRNERSGDKGMSSSGGDRPGTQSGQSSGSQRSDSRSSTGGGSSGGDASRGNQQGGQGQSKQAGS